MGCLFAKPVDSDSIVKNKSSEVSGKYSWDDRKNINPKDYTIENLKDETVGRMPGTVNGHQFIIQNCEDCNIYIFDHSNTITIDDCTKCRIFLGPVKGSVFFRNCEDCKCMVACQQFRTRDCRRMDSFLCCTTQPIIEASTAMKFGCYCWYYPELEDQFHSAGLSEFNNNWSTIHDFTPVEGENNWSLLPEDSEIENFIPLPSSSPFSELKISSKSSDSFVPQTAGLQQKLHEMSCLVVFFSDGQSHERAKSFIQTMKQGNSLCSLINSKEISLEASEAENVFNTNAYSQVVGRGPLIGLEYNGEDCIMACQNAAMNIATETGSTGLVYVSTNAKNATKQIDRFFNYAQMQMNI